MAGHYTPPKLTDIPFPDIFMLVAQQNPGRPLVQIIQEHVNAPTDCVRFTWNDVIRHSQNTAEIIRTRWGEALTKSRSVAKAQPREPGSPPVVVGVLGKNGYELYVNILACLLNRWTVLIISPKNSPSAVEHLLNISGTSLILMDPESSTFRNKLKQSVPSLVAQTLVDLATAETGQSDSKLTTIPTSSQLKKEMDTPAFYLHTSGSTGNPQIVPWSHEFVLAGARTRLKDDSEFIGLPYYSISPLFHIMGVCVYFLFAVAHGNLLNFVSTPTPKPPSAASLLSHLPFIQGGLVMVSPSILDDLYDLGPDAVRRVAKATKFVVSGGAPLAVSTGNALAAAGMQLSTGWGSTEVGQGTRHTAKKRPEDWEYVEFCEGYTWHFLPIDDHSNLRELIVGPGEDRYPAAINYDNPRGCESRDIWEPHPTLSGFWKHHSRKGDVTLLSNGEKTDNKEIENLLLKDRRILYVQVFGSGRPLNGVILQPADHSKSPSEFLALIHPTIEHVNTIIPKHSRLLPELVIIAPSDRAFATTDKGTVRKEETLKKFEQEIEDAYTSMEEGGALGEWPFEGNISEERDLKRFVRGAVRTVLGKTISDDYDLFDQGLDSLLAIRLRTAVVSVTRRAPNPLPPVPRNVAYTFPTINALTAHLVSRIAPGASQSSVTIEERILNCVSRYSAEFVPRRTGGSVKNGKLIAVSGSTGSLGTSILDLLLRREDVDKIFLLNRKGEETQELRQAKSFKERGLDPTLLELKANNIVYFEIDLCRSDLGLSNSEYAQLRDNVTHIIHAAWHLNFNLIMESYEQMHIAGVRHLIDLALSSPHKQSPRLVFLSSLGAAANYHGPTYHPTVGDAAGQRLVPEGPIDDPTIVLDQGYGQSKYVGERIIVNAVGVGLRATVVRVGQLSGITTNGAWAKTEHVPMLVRSSLTLGLVPEDLPPIRWVPSDIAASAIIKQTFADTSPLQYFSVENPFPTQWKIAAETLAKMSPRPVQLVSMETWLEHIKKSNVDPHEVPATKILEFYETLSKGAQLPAALGWDKSVGLAPELAVGSISCELLEKYFNYQQQL